MFLHVPRPAHTVFCLTSAQATAIQFVCGVDIAGGSGDDTGVATPGELRDTYH